MVLRLRRMQIGTAIPTANSKSHEASTPAWQRSSKAEVRDAIVPSFTFNLDLHVLHAWGGGGLLTAHRYWIDGKFLMNHLCLLLGVLLLSIPNKVLSILPLLLLGKICLSSHTWRSFLCPGGWESNKDARDLLMRLQLQDSLQKSSLVTQEQDNQNKVNLQW